MRIIVVGGGASGLMAAIQAAKLGGNVTVLEGREKPAKKIYATGNGKCNLSNERMGIEYYHSGDEKKVLLKYALEKFGVAETKEFFEGLGMMLKDRDGYLYPSTGQASTVGQLLVRQCELLGVQIICNTMVDRMEKRKGKFYLSCTQEIINPSSQNEKKKKESKVVSFKEVCDKVILATGTRAGGFGCEVEGTTLAGQLGCRCMPVVSALTALKCEEVSFFKQVKGVRIEAEITLFEGQKKVLAKERGELQLTDYGISGIPVFQISRHAAYAKRDGKIVTAAIDFLPEFTYHDLCSHLRKMRDTNPNLQIFEVFTYIFPSKLAQALVRDARQMKRISDLEIEAFVKNFKAFRVTVREACDISSAQVCAGGVDTREVGLDFQAKRVKNLYITGELLDVDGICGGYNLQFAWSSGYLAGSAAASQKEEQTGEKDAVY